MDSASPPASWRRLSRDTALLAALCYVCFVNTFQNPFVDYDDENGIRANPHVHGLTWQNVKHALSLPEPGEWRRAFLPVRDLSLALDYSIWRWRHGDETRWEGIESQLHRTNFLLHTANTALVYLLFLALGIGADAALLASAIFACHPIHVESMSWISGRKDVLSGLLFLGALLAWLRAERHGRSWLVLAMALYALAGLCKATTLVLPLLAASLDLLRNPDGNGRKAARDAFRACWRGWIPFFGLGLGLCVLHGVVALGAETLHLEANRSGAGHLNYFSMVAHYFWKFLFPVQLSLRYADDLPWLAWPVLVAWSGILWLTVSAMRDARPAASGLRALLLFTFFCLLPVCGVLPTGTRIADRYFYLPSIGATGLLALGLAAAIRRQPAFRAVSLVLLLSLGATTIWRNALWADSEQLWENAIHSAPRHTVVQYNLACNYLRRGAYERASPLLQQAYEQLPDSPDVPINLAAVRMETGDADGAERLCRAVLAKEPGNVQARLILGFVELNRGQLDSATSLFGAVLREQPRNVATHIGLGKAYSARSLFEEAVRSMAKAVEIDPTFYEARREMAKTLCLVGDLPKAAAAYEAVLRIRPGDLAARKSLADIYLSLGNHDDALANYRHLAEAQPNRADNHCAMARVLENLGADAKAIQSWQRALELDSGCEEAKAALKNHGVR
jgi:tetratricopeptide (TPR) repeat protein